MRRRAFLRVGGVCARTLSRVTTWVELQAQTYGSPCASFPENSLMLRAMGIWKSSKKNGNSVQKIFFPDENEVFLVPKNIILN